MDRDFSCLREGNEKSFRPISRHSMEQKYSSDQQLSPMAPSPSFKKSPRLKAVTPSLGTSDLKLNYACPMCKRTSGSGAFTFPLRWYVNSTPHIREGFCSAECLHNFEELRTTLSKGMEGITTDNTEWAARIGRVLYDAQTRGFKVCFSRYNRERTTCASILSPKESYKGYCKSCDASCEGCKEPRRSCYCCHECKKLINSPECCYYKDFFLDESQ